MELTLLTAPVTRGITSKLYIAGEYNDGYLRFRIFKAALEPLLK